MCQRHRKDPNARNSQRTKALLRHTVLTVTHSLSQISSKAPFSSGVVADLASCCNNLEVLLVDFFQPICSFPNHLSSEPKRKKESWDWRTLRSISQMLPLTETDRSHRDDRLLVCSCRVEAGQMYRLVQCVHCQASSSLGFYQSSRLSSLVDRSISPGFSLFLECLWQKCI